MGHAVVMGRKQGSSSTVAAQLVALAFSEFRPHHRMRMPAKGPRAGCRTTTANHSRRGGRGEPLPRVEGRQFIGSGCNLRRPELVTQLKAHDVTSASMCRPKVLPNSG
jgi:hypothetical protein